MFQTSSSWAVWAVILFFQNISFTYVSRARSSGSLTRHLKASIFSNGIWIFSQMILLGPMFDYLTGKHGHLLQLAAAGVYTVSTVSGSLFAHFWALRTEKGKSAVGYNKKYAQIPVEEWEQQKRLIAEAYGIATAIMPDSGISARKVEGEVVIHGMESGRFKS